MNAPEKNALEADLIFVLQYTLGHSGLTADQCIPIIEDILNDLKHGAERVK